MPERLPFLDEPKPIESKLIGNDNKRMIELLEAIDWKLWMLYNMFSKGNIKIEMTNMDTNPTTDKKLDE